MVGGFLIGRRRKFSRKERSCCIVTVNVYINDTLIYLFFLLDSRCFTDLNICFTSPFSIIRNYSILLYIELLMEEKKKKQGNKRRGE